MSPPTVPVGMTPVPRYSTWDDHRRSLHRMADDAWAAHQPVEQVPRDPQRTVAGPTIELIDEPESVVVYVELPGFERDDVHLKADSTVLTISATRETDEGDGKTLYSERPSRVERSVRLPVETNPDEAEATYENGVLEVRLPKEEAGKQKSIDVR